MYRDRPIRPTEGHGKRNSFPLTYPQTNSRITVDFGPYNLSCLYISLLISSISAVLFASTNIISIGGILGHDVTTRQSYSVKDQIRLQLVKE